MVFPKRVKYFYQNLKKFDVSHEAGLMPKYYPARSCAFTLTTLGLIRGKMCHEWLDIFFNRKINLLRRINKVLSKT